MVCNDCLKIDDLYFYALNANTLNVIGCRAQTDLLCVLWAVTGNR